MKTTIDYCSRWQRLLQMATTVYERENCYNSDHCAIVGIRKLHRVKPPPPRLVDIRNYKNYDTALFKDDLQHVPWDKKQDKAFETQDEVWNSFKDHFLTVTDKHAPVVTRRVRGKTLPWLTPELKNLMQEREHFHKKAIRTNKEIHWSSYKRLRNFKYNIV